MTLVRHTFDPATGQAIFVTPDNPVLVGLDAVPGSLANMAGGGRFFSKFGPAITDWSEFAASSGFLPLSGGSLNPSAGLTVPGAFVAQGSVSFTNRPTTGGVTYMLTGDNAASATKLATPRAINGVNFDGTAAITIAAAAGTLTGATLASNILASSLTSVGTLLGLNVNGALAQTGGQFSTSQQAVSGSAVSGFGGGWVSKDDGGTNRWAAGVLGAAGARAYQIFDIVNSRSSFVIDATTGVVSIGLGLNVAGGITGTLQTSAQPNVTSLGTLTSILSTAAGITSANTITSTGGTGWTSVGWAKALALGGSAVIAFGAGLGVGVKRFLIGNSAGVLYFGTVADDGTGTPPAYAMMIDGPTGIVSFTNPITGTLGTNAQPNITSLGTLSSLSVSGSVVASSHWGGAVSNGIGMYTGQGASGSIAAGSTIATSGATGGSLNLFGRADSGTVGQGVIISYYDSAAGLWRAALDVRNGSGLQTLTLMAAGGSVGVGGNTVMTGAHYFNTYGPAAIFAQATGGANAYHQLFDASGGSAVHLGGTADPGNYYSNTSHHWRSRAGVDWVTLTASVLQVVVPQYIISDSQSFTLRAGSSGAGVYMAFQNSASTRRGYFGYGLGSSPNMYINNDEAGPIIMQANGGIPTASFATSGITFNYGTTASGTSSSTGSSAGFSWADRVSGASWLWYASSGIGRLWNSTTGDVITVTTGGAVLIPGPALTVSGILSLAATGIQVGGFDAGVFTNAGSIYIAQRSTGAGLSINYANGNANLSGSLAVATTLTAPTMTAGTFATQGLLRLSAIELYLATVGGDSSYSNTIQIREQGHAGGAGNNSSVYAPRLAFHWGGIVASQIAIESGGAMAWRAGGAGQTGRIAFINNPGTGYESIAANSASFAGDVVTNGDTYVNQGARGWGLVGVYDPAVYRLVYAMGGSYRTATDGSTLGNLYGIFYAFDATSGGKNATGKSLNHGMGIAANGVPTAFIGQSGIWTSGPVYGLDFILNSDVRLKQNLSRIENALDRICAMSGYTYEMIANPERRRAGVLAQEVRGVMPEAVFTDGLGMMGVSYDALVPVIIEGMKELRAEVAMALRSRA